MALAPEPSVEEQAWTIAVARLIFGAGMNIQSPPNLRPRAIRYLVEAGLNDPDSNPLATPRTLKRLTPDSIR